MSESDFVVALSEMGNDLRCERSELQANLQAAEATVAAFRDWSGPVGAELSACLATQLRYLGELPDQLRADAVRVERLIGRLSLDILPARWCKPRIFVKCFVNALEDEFRQPEAAWSGAPVVDLPQPFQISRTPAETAPVARQLFDGGQALTHWAENIDFGVAARLGVCFDTLFSPDFLPSLEMARAAKGLGLTLNGLGMWLDTMARVYRDCERAEVQFQPLPADLERPFEFEFDLLILRPEQRLFRNSAFSRYGVIPERQLALPIQVEPKKA